MAALDRVMSHTAGDRVDSARFIMLLVYLDASESNHRRDKALFVEEYENFFCEGLKMLQFNLIFKYFNFVFSFNVIISEAHVYVINLN